MTAERQILWWRDIPAQVVARRGRRSEKRMLPDRFQEAIDRAAMRSGAAGTDDYLAAWRRGASEPCGDDLAAEAGAEAQRLDAVYDSDRLAALIASGGREPA